MQKYVSHMISYQSLLLSTTVLNDEASVYSIQCPTGKVDDIQFLKSVSTIFYISLLQIDHLHASENILIAFLIAVMSQLDAAVTCINVLQPMGIR